MPFFKRSAGFALLFLSSFSFSLKEMVIQVDLTNGRREQRPMAQKALAMAEDCLRRSPEDVACLYYRGQVLGLSNQGFFGYTKRVRQMIKDWEKVMTIDPTFDHGGPYRMIAEVYMELPKNFGPKDLRKDLNKAIQYLKKATEISDYPTNWFDLAETYIMLGEKEAAQKALQKAKTSLPKWQNDPYYPAWILKK